MKYYIHCDCRACRRIEQLLERRLVLRRVRLQEPNVRRQSVDQPQLSGGKDAPSDRQFLFKYKLSNSSSQQQINHQPCTWMNVYRVCWWSAKQRLRGKTYTLSHWVHCKSDRCNDKEYNDRSERRATLYGWLQWMKLGTMQRIVPAINSIPIRMLQWTRKKRNNHVESSYHREYD